MTINTNPLSYNQWVEQVGVMAVVQVVNGSVNAFSDQPLATITPMVLNYAELRIQRDLDLLPSISSNTYTLTAGNNILAIPIDDFMTIQTIGVGTGYSTSQLTPVSKEYIQTVFGSLQGAAQPRVFAMVGDTFGYGADTNNNVLLGPVPNFAYTVTVYGTIRTPSLYSYASAGPADTSYTYISTYYPDMLMMASLIYVSAFQRNFSATSDDPNMGMSYEKQYQALRLGAIGEENRKKFQGSGWSSYATPAAATPTR